jgi:hypothetical protein
MRLREFRVIQWCFAVLGYDNRNGIPMAVN